ncbi:MAG: hypothetical protein J6V91_05530, partial [Kiritimatiellae bacterium]|nr:hypothetical protein [Kiritimatiellia bacterium]
TGELALTNDVTIGGLSGAGTISIPSGKDLTYASTTESTFSGTIAGAGGLTVSSGTLVLTGANTYNGATTIAQGAKVIANSGASSTWDYVSNTDSVREPDVTVNGELEIQSSGELYRGFAGTGKITTSGNVTIGMTGDSGHVSGLTNFKGELIVATGTTLTLKGWGLPHNIELSSLQANGNVTATHAGNSPSTTQMTVHELAGSGAISGVNTFTLADGATIDVSAATAVTVNATTISLPDALAVTLPDAAEMPVTLLNTIAFAGNVGDVEGVTLTVDGEQTGDYLLNKTATALTLAAAPWTTVTEVTAEGDVDSWSELLAEMTANRQVFDAATGTLTINFGDKPQDGEAVPGTFTFDGGDVTLASITVTGTNGGTIVAANGTTVTVSTSAAINTAVAVTGQIQLNGATIAADAELAITNYAVLGTPVSGTGALKITGATLSRGLDADIVSNTWTGTVILEDVDDNNLDLRYLVNDSITSADDTLTITASSSLTIKGMVKAYIYDCAIDTLTLDGTLQMRNGTTNKNYTQCVTVNTLAGAGTFIGHQGSEVYVAINVKDWTNFTGSIDLSHEKSNGMIFFFGEAPERFATSITPGNVGAEDSDFTDADYGTLYVTAGETLATTAGKTWHLRKLIVEEEASFQIKGWATIATSCSGAVSVESGATLDLRALNDLSGINATVKSGGRILVKSGATVPDSIVFEAGAILGICPASVDDIGSATLTVTAEGTANSVAMKKGYKTDGVTPLTGWADKGAQGDTLSFSYDPVFDGELCWWAYEFDKEENTSNESNLGPISTGRDKTRMTFDGRGDSNRHCEGNEYVETSTDNEGNPVTKAIRLASGAYRSATWPEAGFTAAAYGRLTSKHNRVLFAFGQTNSSNPTIALATGASANSVQLVLIAGREDATTPWTPDVDTPYASPITVLAETTVPNATTEDHLFAFSYELKDTNDDDTADTTEIVFYVDGDKYQPYKVNKVLTIGGGFQMGTTHSGLPYQYLTRMNEEDADATIEFLRVYDDVLPDETFTAMANAYPYISKVGRATRTIVAGADSTWHEATDWEQTEVVLDANGNFTYNDDGSLKFQTENQEEPNCGTIETPEVGTQVVLNVDGANTLYLNEFYSSTSGNSKLYYERLEINGEG